MRFGTLWRVVGLILLSVTMQAQSPELSKRCRSLCECVLPGLFLLMCGLSMAQERLPLRIRM